MNSDNSIKKKLTPNHKLQDARLQHGWTHEEVAKQIELPDPSTVRRWERGESFPRPRYRRALRDIFGMSFEELGLLQPSVHQHASILEGRRAGEAFTKLPTSFNAFVGRKQDVEMICDLLKSPDVRLLTLLGTGGIGKTRLGVEAAIQMRDQFADGICYVLLTPLRDPAALLPTIVAALGLHDNFSLSLEQQVKAFLRERQVLLLLDNFEHIDVAAPRIEELLRDCPNVKVLVTSRHVLQLEAEQTFNVHPLSLPNPKLDLETTNLTQYAAVALFIQRARTYLPSFKVTEHNAQAIAELCIRLDGLPLAIELAAARIKLFSPQELLERILQDQRILKSDRHSVSEHHRTLDHTIQWSYDLLNEQEQWLFRSLSVFSGSFSLATVEDVFGPELPSASTIVELVSSLLNKSLLQRIEQEHGEPRFMVLETIRAYALDCLQQKGEREQQWCVYVTHYLALVEQAEPFLKKPQQALWLAKLDQELDNLRASLQWFIEQKETELALRFCEVFGKFCGLRGYWREEQYLLRTVLQLPRPPQKNLQGIYGRVLRRAGHLAYRLRDLGEARTLLEQSEACSREANDWQNLAGVLSTLGWVFYRQNEIDKTQQLLQESLAMARRADDHWVLANTLESVGRFLHFQEDLEGAYVLLQESLAISRRHLDKESVARILTTAVKLEIAREQMDRAMQLAQESFLLAQELNTRPLIALTLGTLGTVAFHQGAYAQAQQYYEERSLIAEELGDLPTVALMKSKLADIERTVSQNEPS